MGKDALGSRMKDNYESRTRYMLPRRSYTIIRLDGKAFHTFTKGFKRPFDMNLINAMNYAAENLCNEIQGAKLAYTQSDEISILLTDFEKTTTSAWFDGNVQKMCSIAASIATAYFNEYISKFVDKKAFFDARVFQIPDRTEVENYFIWRQNDCVRNSISMTAQNLYSHRELNGKNTNQMQEMCFQKGTNWNDMPTGFKRGRVTYKEEYVSGETTRNRWTTKPAPDFIKERPKLSQSIPYMNINETV